MSTLKSVTTIREDIIPIAGRNLDKHRVNYTEYDEQGREVKVINYDHMDEEDDFVEYVFNAEGEKAEEIYAQGGEVLERKFFFYDKANRVSSERKEYLEGNADTIEFEYDDEGKMASEGELIDELFDKLELLSYYHQNYPKSLGKEWVLKEFIPILNSFDISVKDKLRTVSQHISSQIKNVMQSKPQANVFVTGGGAYNTFLINTLKLNSDFNIIIPEREIIDFKEALIFAFLGVLRMRGEINCLQSVTGAKKDNCGGYITL